MFLVICYYFPAKKKRESYYLSEDQISSYMAEKFVNQIISNLKSFLFPTRGNEQ